MLIPVFCTAILFFPALDSGCTSEILYGRVFDCISGDSSARTFLQLDPADSVRQALQLVDTLYTIDRFPFDDDTGQESVSIYRAITLRPLRKQYVPSLSGKEHETTTRGIVFVSPSEHGSILVEIFATHKGMTTYEEYCMSTDSMKFLLSAGSDCTVRVVRHIRLLR
jgi:hypothetical protein